MSTLAVVRHTRQNEETGRTELIGSAVVGHLAPLTAALLVVAGADLVVGALSAGVMVTSGLPMSGSLLFGAAIAGAGIAFAAVAAVTAQVSETARGANGLAAASVGVAFLARAVGDVAGDVAGGGTRTVSAWPSWLSPIGWAQQTRPYDLDQWWALALVVVFSAGLVGLAFALTATRDVGAGLRADPARPGVGLGSAVEPVRPGVAAAARRARLVAGLRGAARGHLRRRRLRDGRLPGRQPGSRRPVRAAGWHRRPGGRLLRAHLRLRGDRRRRVHGPGLLRMRTEEASDRLEPVLAAHVARPRWMAGHT